MDLNQWSLLLSIVGVVLGVISAYPQLRGAAQSALKMGAAGVTRMMGRLYAEADFFIAFPSALIAYAIRAVLLMVAISWIGHELLHPASPARLELPTWLEFPTTLVFAFIFGKVGGDLVNVLMLVIRRAKRLHRQQAGGG